MMKTWLIQLQALGRKSHCSDATAANSYTKIIILKKKQCDQRRQGRPHNDYSAPGNENDAKDRNVKIIIAYIWLRKIYRMSISAE